MDKTGVLTFHRAVNYGAVLQAYALCNKLNEMGMNAEVIDYRCAAVENCYYQLIPAPFRIKQLVKNILGWNIQRERNRLFQKFTDQYLPISSLCAYRPKDLIGLDRRYGRIIAGSDQIWNQLCTKGDTVYYLDFVNKQEKRLSYAASFGRVDEEYMESKKYRDLLSGFSHLSVREEEGKDIVKAMTGREARVCLDPSFLVSRETWEGFIREKKEPYLFVYSIDMPEALVVAAERIAAYTGLKVIFITLNNIFKKKGWQNASASGPQEFLTYMASADYVVTNSFHGTAFSIIFGREFYMQPHFGTKMDNSRLTHLLSKLELSDRILTREGRPDLGKSIDYQKTNRILDHLKQESEDYLKMVMM